MTSNCISGHGLLPCVKNVSMYLQVIPVLHVSQATVSKILSYINFEIFEIRFPLLQRYLDVKFNDIVSDITPFPVTA